MFKIDKYVCLIGRTTECSRKINMSVWSQIKYIKSVLQIGMCRFIWLETSMLSYIVRYGSLSDRLTKCDFKHVKENRYIHVYASSMEYMIWKQGNHGWQRRRQKRTLLKDLTLGGGWEAKTWQDVMIVLLLASRRVMLSASQSPLVCLTFSYFRLTISTRVCDLVLLFASRSPIVCLTLSCSSLNDLHSCF